MAGMSEQDPLLKKRSTNNANVILNQISKTSDDDKEEKELEEKKDNKTTKSSQNIKKYCKKCKKYLPDAESDEKQVYSELMAGSILKKKDYQTLKDLQLPAAKLRNKVKDVKFNENLYGDKVKHIRDKFQTNRDLEMCTQCQYFRKLEIDGNADLGFTDTQYSLLIFGIVTSPICWIWISFITPSTISLLISIIFILISFCCGCCCCFATFVDDEYGLTSRLWFYHVFHIVSSWIINIILIIELFRIYFAYNINIINDCNFLGNIDNDNISTEQCVIYLDLIGYSLIIFLCTLFINVAIMKIKRVRYEEDEEDIDIIRKEESLKLLKESFKNNHEFFQNVQILIDELLISKVSMTNNTILNNLRNKCWNRSDELTRNDCVKIIFTLITILYSLVLSTTSWYTYGDIYINNISFHFIETIPCAILSFIAILLLISTLQKLIYIYDKSFALMKVLSNPDKFITNTNDNNYDIDTIIENTSKNNKNPNNSENQKKEFLLWINNINISECINKLIDDGYDDINILKNLKLNELYSYKLNNKLDDDAKQDNISLNKWWNLRRHIISYELPFYYELTNPIITLQILFVILFSLFFIFELFLTYNGNIIIFLDNIFSNNISTILFLFTILIIMLTLFLSVWISRSYNEKKQHIKYIQNKIEIFKFKYSHTTNENKSDKYLRSIDLCEYLLQKMEKETLGPKILGYELNENRLLAFRTYIIGIITTFIGATILT